MAFESLFIYDNSDHLIVGNILLISIALLFIGSWLFFWYFISHKKFIQLSSISISTLIISLTLSFVINIFYYIFDDNVISDDSYKFIIFLIMIFYAIGHLTMIISFLLSIKQIIKVYQRPKYHLTIINISFFVLSALFLSFCIVTIVPTFYYITALFNIWLLLETFVTINIIYLYISQSSYFHIKYNQQEYQYQPQETITINDKDKLKNINTANTNTKQTISRDTLNKMIRDSWNIISTLSISLICMIVIVVINPPFHNLSHVIISINIFVHILCIISFIEYMPSYLNTLCIFGDKLCGCYICYNQCIKKSFKNKYRNPKESVVGIDHETGNKIYRHHAVQTLSINAVRTRSEATWDGNPTFDGQTVYRHKQVIEMNDRLKIPQKSHSTNSSINSTDEMLGNHNRKIKITQWVDSMDDDDTINRSYQEEEEEKGVLLQGDFGYDTVDTIKSPNSMKSQKSMKSPNSRSKLKNGKKSESNKKRKKHDLIHNHRSLLCGESIMELQDKWLRLNADTFKVRPKDYYTGDAKKRKGAKKVPSSSAIYDVFAVDGYQMNEKLNFMQAMEKYDIDLSNIVDTTNITASYLPFLIIVNVILPITAKKEEKNYLQSSGIQITLYSKLSKDSQEILNQFQNGTLNELPESMALFSKFIHSTNNDTEKKEKIKDDDIRNAIKLTMRVNNLAETSLPFVMKKLVKKANGESIVMKYGERVTYFMDKSKQYFVIDIDGYTLPKKVLSMWNTARNAMDSIIYDIGFHISGRCQQDLPEQMLCCTQINKLSIKDMPLINDMKLKQKPSTMNVDIDNLQRRLSYMYLSDKEIVVSSPSARSRSSRYMMDSGID